MFRRLGVKLRNLNVRRTLRLGAIVFMAGLLLTLALIVALPTIISSQPVQSRLQLHLTKSLKRTVSWSQLTVSWRSGLQLAGLKLGIGPAPLLQTSLGDLSLVPDLGRGPDGRWYLALAVKVRNLQADLAPGPPKPKPKKPTKDPLTAIAEAVQQFEQLDWSLPVDLRLAIDCAPLTLSYHDPATGRTLKLDDATFSIAMPSLSAKPITMAASSRLTLNGRQLQPLQLKAQLTNLVTPKYHLHPASAELALDGTFHGVILTAHGGVSNKAGFKLHGQCNLAQLRGALGPLVPAHLPIASGNLALDLQARLDQEQNLQLHLGLDGTQLAVSGGKLRGPFGPIDLQLRQQLATNRQQQRVTFTDGSLQIPALLALGWQATVDRPTAKDRTLALQLGPLRLDLARTLVIARSLLSPQTVLPDVTGELALQQLHLRLIGPNNNGDLSLNGLQANLPTFKLSKAAGPITGEGLQLTVERLIAPLTSAQPTSLTATLALSAQQLRIAGAKPLTVQGLQSKLTAELPELVLKSRSPRRFSGAGQLNQTITCDRLAIGDQLTIDRLQEQLRLQVRAGTDGLIELQLPELTLATTALKTRAAGKQLAPFPAKASLTFKQLLLPVGTTLAPRLEQAVATLAIGDALKLSANGGLGSNQQITTRGELQANLAPLLPLLAPFLPKGVTASGQLTGIWDLAGLQPKKPAQSSKNPLQQAKGWLAQLEQGEIQLKLSGLNLLLPQAKGKLSLTGGATDPPLRLQLVDKGEVVHLTGGLHVAGLSGLPGKMATLPPQRLDLNLDLELAKWNQLHLTESLAIKPLGLAQSGTATLSRLDSLLDEPKLGLATLLRRLDAGISTQVKAVLSPELQPLLPGLELAGNATADLRLQLAAGRELTVGAGVKSTDFGLRLANGTSIEGLRTDLRLDRSYALVRAERSERWNPLSASLVQPLPELTINQGARDLINRLRGDLRQEMTGSRSLRIRRLTVKAGGLPVVLTALEADLLLNREEAGLSFLQADLLGGSLQAGLLVNLRPEMPQLTSSLAFSHLDTALLLPADSRPTASDSELTGELSLALPLTTVQRELLEALRCRITIRQIGANTLERLLFSLDPYERNEKLVAQRKMLRLGGIKGLRASAVDGSFSLEGEAEIKGVAVDLPRVERLRLADLSLRQQLAQVTKGIAGSRPAFDLLRADLLLIAPDGKISLQRRNHGKENH